MEELILELLLVEGLEALTLELLLVEGLEELTLELLLLEDLAELTLELLVEGLEVLTLELLPVEGLEELTLELLLVEGLEELTLELLDLELEDLDGLEDLEEEELLEADRLPPLDLLLLERDDLAITEPVINIKDKAIENRIALRFFDCFRFNMARLLFVRSFSDLYPNLLLSACIIKKPQNSSKNAIKGVFIVLLHPCSIH